MSLETARLYFLTDNLSQEQIEEIWSESETDLKMNELNYESDNQIHMFGSVHIDQISFLDVLRASRAPFFMEQDSYEGVGHTLYFDGHAEKHFGSGIKDYESCRTALNDFIALSNEPSSQVA